MGKYLITSALPYANGKLHVGHVAGAYLPADIYNRFLQINKHDVVFVCGTDEHGAPISIRAEADSMTPQQIVDFYHQSIKDSFEGLYIKFQNFSGTARKDHHLLSQKFFSTLLKNDKIVAHSTQQFYCETDSRFLPDRYVQGTCPHCSADGARGDQCDTCGKLIDSLSLVEPKCKICGNTPIIKETNHWFLSLPAFSERLKQWLENKPNWKDNVKKFILSWIEEGLIERSITRDIDWGVPVPLPDAKGKVLYVWFDAPIGYISSTIEWSKKIGQPELWKKYWLDKDTKLVHFIGKDNIPFHAIIWPAILMGQDDDYVLPYDIPANEYLTLEGQKISTSNEWAIWVEEYLHFFDGELLRFYLATNAPETKDADFTWKDFQNVINNTLANVLGNLANRVFAFAQKNFDGTLRYRDSEFITSITDSCAEIHEAYTEFKVRKAVKCIMDIAREGNKFFDEAKPWVLIKHDKSVAEKTLYECAELLRIISITLYPILPKSMQRLRDMMTISGHIYWEDIYNPPKSIQIGVFEPLFKKIEDEDIKRQIEMLYKNAP